MLKKTYIVSCSLIFLFFTFHLTAQINNPNYLTSEEIFNVAKEKYANEDYNGAYQEFIKINSNDTAYFLSRYYAVLSLGAENKYDSVVQLCREVLQVENYNAYQESFMNSLAHGLIQKEKYTEALVYIDQALIIFPRSYLLWYNRSSVLYELKEYNKAVEALQTSLRFNPRYYYSHMKLGAICASAGQYARAAMCFNMAIFLKAETQTSMQSILTLERMYSGGFETKINKLDFNEDEDFEELDLLIKNKLAENSKYKVNVKLDYNFIKHNQLLFENLKFDVSSKGFWNQNYIRWYAEVMKKGDFANFSYYQCLSVDNDKTQKVINKNKSKVIVFLKWSIDEYKNCMNERLVRENDSYVKNSLRHEGDYGFNEEVVFESNQRKGPFSGFNEHGLVSTKGVYSENGDPVGTWHYFDDQGRLETAANFENGEITGNYTIYYSNASKKKELIIKNGKPAEIVKNYYNFNRIYSEVPIKENGNENGEAVYFHPNGKVSNRINYKDGKRHGKFFKYFSNGQIELEMNYVDGKREGEITEYHKNGSIAIKGQYLNDLHHGHWKYIHENGVLEEEGELKEGYRIGKWKSFRENGKIYLETDYGQTGKKTGILREYDEEGYLALELEYKGEEITKYRIYNKKGELTHQNEKKKNELEYENYHDNGKIAVKGNYSKGEKIGKWYYYNRSGKLTSEHNFDQTGKMNGEFKWYFENGEIETVKNYKDGAVDGYFVEYYKNGKKFKEGWFRDGEPVGEWVYYYKDGSISSTSYYLEGVMHGEYSNYNEKGALSYKEFYFFGSYEGIQFYDSLENKTGRYMLKDGEGDFTYLNLNGNTATEISFLGAKLNGQRKFYYENGQISAEGQIIDGDRVGEWKWYYRSGKISSTGNYEDGVKDGSWKWYYENGNLCVEENYTKGNLEGSSFRFYINGKKEWVRNYKDDERNGESSYFDPSGQLQAIRYYEKGQMIGYSYQGSDKNPVELIPFDKQNGIITTYFANGNKSYYSEYKNGYNEGKTVYYHSNGKEHEVRFYVNNELEGMLIEYFSNGQKAAEKNFFHGDLHGESRQYYENGKLKSIENYVFDTLYGQAEYYSEDGKLLEKVHYYNGTKIQ